MKSYEIYKITNTINNKVYIGMTSQGYLNRWNGDWGSHVTDARRGLNRANGMYEDIRTHGESVFKVELLESNLTKKDAMQIEETLIRGYKGEMYNEMIGHKHSRTTKEQLSKSHKDFISNMSEDEFSKFVGRLNTPEAKAKRDEVRRGRPIPKVRGKNHGLARRVHYVEEDKYFDTILQCHEYISSKIEVSVSSIKVKLRGGTVKKLDGITLEYSDNK